MVSIQYTKFTDLNFDGSENVSSYGYRIYSDENSEYSNYYENINELRVTINNNNIKEFLKENHLDFYEIIKMDKKLEFNGNIIYL